MTDKLEALPPFWTCRANIGMLTEEKYLRNKLRIKGIYLGQI